MLININVFIIENVDLIIIIRKKHIDNYRITFKFTITLLLKTFIKQNVMFEKSISILTHFYIIMFIKYINLLFENYMLELINEYLVILFAIIINSLFHAILTSNDFKQAI